MREKGQRIKKAREIKQRKRESRERRKEEGEGEEGKGGEVKTRGMARLIICWPTKIETHSHPFVPT